MKDDYDHQYLNLVKQVLDQGTWETNRTGVDTKSIPGAMLQLNVKEHFPLLTTKQVPFKAIVGELIGFLKGINNAAEFRELGCNVWNQNANENQQWLSNRNRKGEDDLGRIYGVQWRNWRGMGPNMLPIQVDQLQEVFNTLRTDPSSRRMIVNAWNPAELSQMALPPCHMMFQLIAKSDKTLHMVMYQRSVDVFLGLPFNMASYALLLQLFAAWSGRKVGTLSMMLADVHIYESHLRQVGEQIKRSPMVTKPYVDINISGNAPNLSLNELVDMLVPDDFQLELYHPHGPLRAPMAV